MTWRNGRLVWGLLLVALGGLWLLNNLRLIHVDVAEWIGRLWPVLLIYFGLAGAADGFRRGVSGQSSGVLWGTVIANGLVAVVGGLLLAERLMDGFHPDLAWIWKLIFPAVLLLAGLAMLTGAMQSGAARTFWAVMGGSNIEQTPLRLHDMAFMALMGGGKVDLTQAELPPSGEVLIDVYAVMGGMEFKLPESLPFTLEGTAIMGGTEVSGEGSGGGGLIDHRRVEAGEGPRLRIRVHCLMGGVTVKRLPAGMQA